jgi:Immunity protein 35
LERKAAWVFFWNTKEYVETGDTRHALGGNAPVVVFKETAQARFLDTARSPEFYLNELEIE